MYKDGLNGESWDLGDKDATEGVGDGGVDADERELRIKGVILVELDIEVLAEVLDVPGVVLVNKVVGEIGRDGVGDGLLVDADSLVFNQVRTLPLGPLPR